MARIRDPNRDKAFEIYRAYNGNIDLVEIARQLNVPDGTVRGWKAKDKWEQKLNGTFQKNNAERSVKKRIPSKKEKRELKKLDLDDAELTEKQRLFCLYYIKNFNATMAAIKAGYSPNTAKEIGYENLTKPHIRKEIQRLKEIKRQSIMLTEDDIIERYIRIAFADMTDFVEFGQEEVPIMTELGPAKDENGNIITKKINVIRFKDSTQVDGGLICQIKQGRDGTSIKLEDRQKALDKLAQYFDLFPDKFQRRIEEEKLKISQQKLELDKLKADEGIDESGEDDGFMEALQGTVKEVWKDEE